MVSYSIIERAKAGDRNAFIQIYNIYRQKVYSTAYFILKDYQYAEDVVQETFIQVHLKLSKLKALEAFDTWLYKITVNHCLKLLKKAKKSHYVELDENTLQHVVEECNVPDSIVIQMEMEAKVMEFIYSLESKYRIVLTLFYFNSVSIRDIADILECSEGTVKSRLHYGRKILKVLLEKEYDASSNNKMGGAIYEC